MVEAGQIVTARIEAFMDASARVLIPLRTRAFLAPKHLSWKRKKQKAEDYFDVSDQILVKVLAVKTRRDKPPAIEVGFRETEPNPWP